jgi:hypothetical protein
MEKRMSHPTKTAVAAIALLGAVITTAALAEKGHGGPEGMGGRGAMLLEEFDTIDADKDGKITAAEFAAHRKARFAAADTDTDGLLTAEEMTAYHMAQMAARMQERTAKMFQWMDTNGDGGLSVDEMPDGPSPMHLARLDADGDGAISKAEAEAARDHFGRRGKKHHGDMADDN